MARLIPLAAALLVVLTAALASAGARTRAARGRWQRVRGKCACRTLHSSHATAGDHGARNGHVQRAPTSPYHPPPLPGTPAERLSVRGNKLVNERGQPVKLHGINWFG